MHPLDQPITIRQLKRAYEKTHQAGSAALDFDRAVKHLVEDAEPKQTDFVKVTTGEVVRVVGQPTRRVQVGDLMTVEAHASRVLGATPRVRRVAAINCPFPVGEARPPLKAVAISPDDAARIETALGRVD